MPEKKGALEMIAAANRAPKPPALTLIPPGAERFLPPGLADYVDRMAAAQPAAAIHEGPGRVEGPGGPTDDTVNAKLSPGEYVMPAKVVDHAGGGDNAAGADLLDQTVKGITGIDPEVAASAQEEEP